MGPSGDEVLRNRREEKEGDHSRVHRNWRENFLGIRCVPPLAARAAGPEGKPDCGTGSQDGKPVEESDAAGEAERTAAGGKAWSRIGWSFALHHPRLPGGGCGCGRTNMEASVALYLMRIYGRPMRVVF